MSKVNWQDPGSGEIISPHVSGLQEAVGKIEDAIQMKTKALTGVALSEVYISDTNRYRIYQAPAGSRNWASNPVPVIKKNAAIISTGFEIDYGGGAVIFNPPILGTDVITADVTVLDNMVDGTGIAAFKLVSAVLNAGAIDVTLGPGRAFFTGGTIVDKSANSTYSIPAVTINTNYFIYLKSDGTFTHNTTGVSVAGQILLWKIATGDPVSVITTTDQRAGVVEPPAYTPANKAGDTFTGQVSVERETATTSAAVSLLQLVAASTGQMADYFGPQQIFSVKDADGVINPIGVIAAQRYGADNSSMIKFISYLAGVQKTFLQGNSDGSVLLPHSPLNIVDSNKLLEYNSTMKALAMSNIEAGGISQVNGRTYFQATANARVVGGSWNRMDTAKSAILLELDDSGRARIYTAAAGANPIAWAGPYEIYHAGNLPATVGGGFSDTTSTVNGDFTKNIALDRSGCKGFELHLKNPTVGTPPTCVVVGTDAQLAAIGFNVYYLSGTQKGFMLKYGGVDTQLTTAGMFENGNGVGAVSLKDAYISGTNLVLVFNSGSAKTLGVSGEWRAW